MSNDYLNQAATTDLVFTDPVAYLARFGIQSTLVACEPVDDPALPEAA